MKHGVAHGRMHMRDVTLQRMGRVFQKLYDSSARPFVCFPLFLASTVLSRSFTTVGVSALLFPNMAREGYR